MPFYQKGDVRIRYEEVGRGFPLLVTPGGGLNSRVSNWPTAAINAMEEFKHDFRCITMDQRNANSGESAGPVPVDNGWDAFADDQLGLMDHLGIREFFYMGYCIGGCFAGKLLQRAPDRIVAAVFHQSVGHRPEDPDVMMRHSRDNWLPDFRARRPEVPWTRSRSISTACGAPGNLARIARTLTQTSGAVVRVTLDKASVFTLGFQIEDDRRHVLIADLGDQVALRQVEVKLDGLLNHGLQRRVSLDVIPHGLRRARPACGLEDLGGRRDNAGALPQCLLNLLDLETRLIHWNLWNLWDHQPRHHLGRHDSGVLVWVRLDSVHPN